MILGMVTIINVTMVGAVMQLAGHVPDASLLVILSRYLRRREEPPEALLLPVEASFRLRRLRKFSGILALAACVPGLAFTIWASAVGWGAAAGAALAFWVVAANLGFLTIPLASLARRASRIRLEEEPGHTPVGENTAHSRHPGNAGAEKSGSSDANLDSPAGEGQNEPGPD